MSKPLEHTFYDDGDMPIVVRYDFEKGEAEWFDAKAGVGSPGYGPCVEIFEVNIGGDWQAPDAYPQLDITRMEQEILDFVLEQSISEEQAHYDALERGYARDRI